MPDTTQLYQAIKEQRAHEPPIAGAQFADRPQSHEAISSTPVPPSLLPLVGRWQELAVMETNYAGIMSDGYFQVLEGEAGIGKTRLADEFLSKAGARRALSLTARCYS